MNSPYWLYSRIVEAFKAARERRMVRRASRRRLAELEPRVYGKGDTITGNLTSQECLRFVGGNFILANDLTEVNDGLQYLNMRGIGKREVIQLDDRGYVIRWA